MKNSTRCSSDHAVALTLVAATAGLTLNFIGSLAIVVPLTSIVTFQTAIWLFASTQALILFLLSIVEFRRLIRNSTYSGCGAAHIIFGSTLCYVAGAIGAWALML